MIIKNFGKNLIKYKYNVTNWITQLQKDNTINSDHSTNSQLVEYFFFLIRQSMFYISIKII